MTSKERKQKARFQLLAAIQTAFSDYNNHSEEMKEEMSKQMERVEKMFGYVPGSWQRGC